MSLLGDGIFLVALAWEAYTISDGPTALALLGIAMSVPLIALLLFGGLISDRKNRRRVMLTRGHHARAAAGADGRPRRPPACSRCGR